MSTVTILSQGVETNAGGGDLLYILLLYMIGQIKRLASAVGKRVSYV